MGLFNLFGQPKPEEYDHYWEFDKANHLRPKIDKANFFKLAGFDFGQLVRGPISRLLTERKDEIDGAKSLSYGQKALYYWWFVDAQVTNGGFVQFYYNDYGRYMPTIIKSLEHIGDRKMVDLLQRAENIYQKNKKLMSRARKKDLFGSDLYDRLDELSKLDDEYYKLNNSTMSNIEKYIKQNPSEFCVDEDGNDFDIRFSGEYKTFYPENQIKAVFTVESGLTDGPFQSFYENGKTKEVIQYSKGELTGETQEYFENGNLKYAVSKDPDLNQFEHYWYYENGQPQKLEHKVIDKNERIGEYKEWYKNGQLAQAGIYKSNSERDGHWREYYEDGSKKLEAEFKNGAYLLHNYWNENGEQTLKDGTGVFTGKGFMQEYQNYKKHGKSYLYSDATLILYQEMENDKEHGYTKRYYKNGKLKAEILYNDGKLISTKQFPLFEKPKVEVKIYSKVCDSCYKDEQQLRKPDNEPQALKIAELENSFKVDKSLFNLYEDNTTMNYSHIVKTDKQGIVKEIKFLYADNLWLATQVEDSMRKMRFEIAYKNSEPVECIYSVRHTFSLTE